MKNIRFIRVMLLMLLCSVLLVGCKEISEPVQTVEETEEKAIEIPPEQQVEAELIQTLATYLDELLSDIDWAYGNSVNAKINRIKKGAQALHVEYGEPKCYFVGAYYKDGHEHETSVYCCADKYSWVKFENASEISETYQGLSFIVAFQINQPSLVEDILTKDASVPKMEHFILYQPTFHNGFNTNSMTILVDTYSYNAYFDSTFIYLNTHDGETVYYTSSEYLYVLSRLPCVHLDGQYYVSILLYILYPSGVCSDGDLEVEFGKYYDALVSVMDTERYRETTDGRTYFYGLIKLEDFASCILG